jgi:transposase
MDGEKKSLIASERDEAARAAWRAMAALWEARQVVFVDESGTQTNMTPRTSRAPRGQRAYGAAPRNHGKNTTLIAALSAAGMGAAMTLEGAADADAFVAYLTHLLAPTLVPGQIVVMDNLSVHKDKRAAPLIEKARCRLVYLPAYSPDMTPSERSARSRPSCGVSRRGRARHWRRRSRPRRRRSRQRMPPAGSPPAAIRRSRLKRYENRSSRTYLAADQ